MARLAAQIESPRMMGFTPICRQMGATMDEVVTMATAADPRAVRSSRQRINARIIREIFQSFKSPTK